MQGMAGLVGLPAREQRPPDQRQIAYQVQRLMSAELVREPQGAVHNPALIEDDCVVERAAANQTHSAQPFEVLHEAKLSRGRQHPAERLTSHAQLDFLSPHGRMRVFHVAMNPEIIRRVNSDAPPALGNFQRFYDLQITPPLPQPSNSGLPEHFNEWLRGTI